MKTGKRRLPTYLAALGLASCASSVAGRTGEDARPSHTGPGAPLDAASLRAFDAPFEALIDPVRVPGCTVAVHDDGRLLVERGYGRARPETTAPRTPARTRMRYASLTKPVTAVAIHRLVERGRLSLDAPVLPLLGLPSEGTPVVDARARDILVRHLLEHSGGFDRDQSDDPMFDNAWIAKELGAPLPLSLDDLVRHVFSRPLDFDPGARFAYSNFGYALLGRIIERTTGQTYLDFVQEELFDEMGIHDVILGEALPARRPPDETWYFPDAEDPFLPDVYSAEHERVRPSDGGFHLEPMAAHGGLVGSAGSFATFLAHVDGLDTPRDVLSAASLEQMLRRPDRADVDPTFFYAHGFWVERLDDGDRIYHHTGAKPGTSTIAVRDADGLVYVALCNGRPLDEDLTDRLDEAFGKALRAIGR